MYTLLRIKKKGETRYTQTGYIYDISQTGMRFELDDPIAPGTELEFRALLPGSHTTTFCAKGHLVRMHDDLHEVGPVRMAMQFDRFKSAMDRQKLNEYIGHRSMPMAKAA
jgi:c-di-GMP-binding flagellar brake protein YcgR